MTIHIVTGPPAAGKTTYIAEHAQPGDITIDYDALAATLSPGCPHDYTQQPEHLTATTRAARRAAIDEAAAWHKYRPDHDVYIIHAIPSPQAIRFYQAKGWQIITINPGYDETMKHAADRTPAQHTAINSWYQQHEGAHP